MLTLEALHARYPAPTFHPLLITEVTRMQNAHFCIAGFDVHAAKMVRPLRPRGVHWIFDEFQDPYFPGQLVNVKPAGTPHGVFPHSNEDLPLQSGMRVLDTLSEPELFAAMNGTWAESIVKLFGCAPVENRYFPEGARCPSIGSIRVPRRGILFQSSSANRLRLRLEDSDRIVYSLPVTCDRLRGLFDPDGGTHGVHAANGWLDKMAPIEPIIVRLGLTRGYAGTSGEFDPKRCYLQVNGLLSRVQLAYE